MRRARRVRCAGDRLVSESLDLSGRQLLALARAQHRLDGAITEQTAPDDAPQRS
jgi:hypothetical protein